VKSGAEKMNGFEKFRQFIFRLGTFKAVALLSLLCLIFQAAVFCLSLIIAVYIIEPHLPTLHSDEAWNSHNNFIFLFVPLVLIFSTFIGSMAVFSIIIPKKNRWRSIIPAFAVAIIQVGLTCFTLPLFFLFLFYGFHVVFAAAPLCLSLILPIVAGNLLTFKAVEKL
jgi:hypothetical protein